MVDFRGFIAFGRTCLVVATEKFNTERVLFADYPRSSPITEETRASNKRRIFTGGVRINNGLYRTSKEDAEYREASLKKKLP